jgi:SAM-dependent methyltransferase
VIERCPTRWCILKCVEDMVENPSVRPSLRAAWEAQAEAWAKWARTPGHDHFFWRYNLPHFLEIVCEPRGVTLDVGCGEGRVGRALTRLGHDVVGIDGSPTLARLAGTHDEPIRTMAGDAAALPLADAVADQAIAFMSLQDVDDLDGTIQELGRVLRPGGALCIAILHPLSTAGDFADESFDSPFVVTRAYPQPRRFVDSVERDGIAMEFHSVHRPLDAYTAALHDAGFVIEVLIESVPDEEYIRDHPRLQRQARIPWYLHLRAVRR